MAMVFPVRLFLATLFLVALSPAVLLPAFQP